MHFFLVLARIAFICNLFFIPVFLLHFGNFITHPVFVSFLIIVGYLLALLINPLLHICYFVLLLLKRNLWVAVPKWLLATNFIFLLVQVFYILLLNDLFHH